MRFRNRFRLRHRRDTAGLAVRQQPRQPLLHLTPLRFAVVEPGPQIPNRFFPLGCQRAAAVTSTPRSKIAGSGGAARVSTPVGGKRWRPTTHRSRNRPRPRPGGVIDRGAAGQVLETINAQFAARGGEPLGISKISKEDAHPIKYL